MLIWLAAQRPALTECGLSHWRRSFLTGRDTEPKRPARERGETRAGRSPVPTSPSWGSASDRSNMDLMVWQFKGFETSVCRAALVTSQRIDDPAYLPRKRPTGRSGRRIIKGISLGADRHSREREARGQGIGRGRHRRESVVCAGRLRAPPVRVTEAGGALKVTRY